MQFKSLSVSFGLFNGSPEVDCHNNIVLAGAPQQNSVAPQDLMPQQFANGLTMVDSLNQQQLVHSQQPLQSLEDMPAIQSPHSLEQAMVYDQASVPQPASSADYQVSCGSCKKWLTATFHHTCLRLARKCFRQCYIYERQCSMTFHSFMLKEP